MCVWGGGGGRGEERGCYIVALSPGQILSCSCGVKLGGGLESLLRHGPKMVDSVSTNCSVLTESTISGL